MQLAVVLLLGWALIGHMALSVAFVNRVHATGIPVRLGKLVWLSAALLITLVPAFFGYWFHVRGLRLGPGTGLAWLPAPAVPYLAACWAAATLSAVDWLWRRVLHRPPAPLRSDRRRVVRLLQNGPRESGEEHEHDFLVHLPGNEILSLDVAERGLELERLPEALDRFTIVHMTDLHFTGRVAKAYFEEVAQICNTLRPDLVAITGDLIDKSRCIAWIPQTLGRLESRYGVFYVLGNHDLRVDTARLRAALAEAGLTYLGGRWLELAVGRHSIVLAGNELPWIAPAADLAAAAAALAGGPPRIALAHSPDQLLGEETPGRLAAGRALARRSDSSAVSGPRCLPSRSGVTYASGTFHDPPTVMQSAAACRPRFRSASTARPRLPGWFSMPRAARPPGRRRVRNSPSPAVARTAAWMPSPVAPGDRRRAAGPPGDP